MFRLTLNRSYAAIGVEVGSIADQLELTFNYYHAYNDGGEPDRQTITIKAVKQDFTTLDK